MNELGYIRVAAASPEVRPADVDFNISEIKRLISDAADKGSDIVLFPELSVTGYTCADLFFQQNLIEKTESALKELAVFSSDKKIAISRCSVTSRQPPLQLRSSHHRRQNHRCRSQNSSSKLQ